MALLVSPNWTAFFRHRPAVIVAVLLTPVLLLAGMMVWQSYRDERATISGTLLSTSRAGSAVIDATVGQSTALLTSLAASGGPALGNLARLESLARAALAGTDRWFVLLDLDGQQLVNTRVGAAGPLPKVEFEPGLLDAMRRGETYMSDLKRSRATGEFVLHVSHPCVVDGELKYILSITLLPRELAKALDVTRYAQGKVVTVVDRRGVIIARQPNAEKFVGGAATPDVVHHVTHATEGTFDSTTLEGIPVVGAFTRARSGWSVVIGAPKDQLYASATRLLLWGGAGLALFIVVALGMAVSADRVLQAETQLRVAQQRLSEHAQQLERAVEQRTESLRQAISQLEEFSYTVSHDLRAPLRTMHSFASILIEEYSGRLDSQGQDYLRRISNAASRMDQLTTGRRDCMKAGRW
jgi:hypothetical protein